MKENLNNLKIRSFQIFWAQNWIISLQVFLNKSLVHNFDEILKINASYLSFMRDMLSFCCIKLFWFYIANAWDVFISFPIKSCKLCYLFPFFTAQSTIITKFCVWSDCTNHILRKIIVSHYILLSLSFPDMWLFSEA